MPSRLLTTVAKAISLALVPTSPRAQLAQLEDQSVLVVVAERIGVADARAAVRRTSGRQRSIVLLRENATPEDLGAALAIATDLSSRPAPSKGGLIVVRSAFLNGIPRDDLAKYRVRWSDLLASVRVRPAGTLDGYGRVRIAKIDPQRLRLR